MMSDNKSAGRVILSELKMFNEAAVLFEQEVHPAFMNAFGEAIQNWAKEHGWSSSVDPDDPSYLLAPPAWNLNNKKRDDDPGARFYWGLTEDDSGYILANLCGVGSVITGLWFALDEKAFGGKRLWKQGLQAIASKYIERLKPLGFAYAEPDFYLPLRLDSGKLADAWSDDIYDDLLEPVVVALNTLDKAVPIFDELITEMRSRNSLQVAEKFGGALPQQPIQFTSDS